jgi:hypothetical protein
MKLPGATSRPLTILKSSTLSLSLAGATAGTKAKAAINQVTAATQKGDILDEPLIFKCSFNSKAQLSPELIGHAVSQSGVQRDFKVTRGTLVKSFESIIIRHGNCWNVTLSIFYLVASPCFEQCHFKQCFVSATRYKGSCVLS